MKGLQVINYCQLPLTLEPEPTYITTHSKINGIHEAAQSQ